MSVLVGSTLPRPADTARVAVLRSRRIDLDEGIVAAGIEDDQPQALGAISRRNQPLQRYRLILGIAVAGEARIDRNEVIDPADFETVAGVIDDGNIGLIGDRFELADRALEFEVADIDQGIDRVEAGVAEHLGDRGRVPRWIGQLRNGLVVRIADDQRHALLGPGRIGGKHHRKEKSPDCSQQ